jgi:hypothetical protein
VQCGEDGSRNTFYTPKGCMIGNRGMGSANGACDSMAHYSLLLPPPEEPK